MSFGLYFPPEILSEIASFVYAAGIPVYDSIDPLLLLDGSAPTALPSSFPPSHWPEPAARRTLSQLCLVNHAWYDAAKPWLWRRVEVRFPQSWMAFLAEIGGDEDDIQVKVDKSIKAAATAAIAASSFTSPGDDATKQLEECIVASLASPDSSIPPELLSPPASREPSPRRIRTKSKSPARWKIMRSINDAVQNVMERDEPGFYFPAPHDPSPGRHVRHLDFNHFRTIGMRRSVGEGVNARFVTGDRLELVLKESPNLTAFGATEYMDGALTLGVLKELLLRGTPSRARGRPSRGRTSLSAENDAEDEERERRKDCRELVALDLTGCVSAVFFNALTEFVNVTLLGSEENGWDRFARVLDTPLSFPGLQRLSLRGTKAIPSDIINSFVLAFPSLTHLDLSATRITPALLTALGESTTVRFQSLALGRCVKLTGESIVDFLVNGSCSRDLTELSLYGDATFPCPLTEEQLHTIVTQAPAFLSGKLQYLDLSSSPLTPQHLANFAPQPRLRSLGLSTIAALPLSSISQFLRNRASNVEVITLIATSPELRSTCSPRQISMAIHQHLVNPLCSAPFKVCLDPSADGYYQAPTRLRVIELATSALAGLGTGVGAWKIIKSKGGRGWYVDTASAWISDRGNKAELKRGLPEGHPIRQELDKLARANGNVGSGVGWHARKMEVLHGLGMLSREDGLYGAVSFAYQG